MPDPVFLSLDGLDGTGKSTQCRLLVDWLRGLDIPVTHCIDPGGTELGNQLREILLSGRDKSIHMRAEALLFMASRAELVDRVIRPALGRSEVVVSDRFTLSNVVYQGHAGGLDPQGLWGVGSFATAGLEPDLTIILDLPVDVAEARRNRAADRLERRGSDYHARVRAGFLAEVARRPDRVTILDATPPPEELHLIVRRAISPLLSGRGHPIPDEG